MAASDFARCSAASARRWASVARTACHTLTAVPTSRAATTRTTGTRAPLFPPAPPPRPPPPPPPLGVGRPDRLPHAHGGPDQQGRDHQHDRYQRRLVPPGRLPRPVPRRRRAGLDRLVRQVPLHVRRERPGAL